MHLTPRVVSSFFTAMLIFIAAPACAGGLYVYVDDEGVPHYSLQKLDERYQLFANDGPALSDDVILAITNKDIEMSPQLPDMGVYSRGVSGISSVGMRVPPPSKAVLTRLLKSANMKRYEPIIAKYAHKHGVDSNLVKAVMAAESGFNAGAISPKSAMGLMQVIAPTAARYGVSEAELMNPERNIYAGVRYLADLSRMFKGRPELVIAAYNAGEGAVYKYKRQIPPYAETQNYVRTVLQFYNVYAPKGSDSMIFASDDTLVSDDGSVLPFTGTSRRGMQRVKMKIGGKLPVVNFE